MTESQQHFNVIGGYLADGFDEIFDGNEKFFADLIRQTEDAYRDKTRPTYQRVINGAANGWLWGAAVTHGIVGRFSQGYVDTLRFGDSLVERSWAGVGKDLLRLLNIIPLAGAAASRFSRFLMVVQVAENLDCAWVSTANALTRTGQKFFLPVEELARVAGVDINWMREIGTNPTVFRTQLLPALDRLRVGYRVLGQGSDLESLVKANPRGTLVVSIEYQGGRHVLLAEARGGGAVFFDTDNKVFNGVRELEAAYPQVHPGDIAPVFIPNAAYINVARSPLLNLFFPVVPFLQSTQSHGTPPQGRVN